VISVFFACLFFCTRSLLKDLSSTGRNALKALPKSLGRLSKLARLDLHQNRMHPISQQSGESAMLSLYIVAIAGSIS